VRRLVLIERSRLGDRFVPGDQANQVLSLAITSSTSGLSVAGHGQGTAVWDRQPPRGVDRQNRGIWLIAARLRCSPSLPDLSSRRGDRPDRRGFRLSLVEQINKFSFQRDAGISPRSRGQSLIWTRLARIWADARRTAGIPPRTISTGLIVLISRNSPSLHLVIARFSWMSGRTLRISVTFGERDENPLASRRSHRDGPFNRNISGGPERDAYHYATDLPLARGTEHLP
jgi:hypothetical protein